MRLALPLLLLLAGCSHVTVDARATSAAPAGSAGVGVHIHSHSAAALVAAGVVAAAAIEHAREPRPFPSFSTFSDWFRGTPAPELDPTRAVNEQDCTRPIELTGNLRCR